MTKKFISSLAAFLAGTGVALAQQTLPPGGPPDANGSKSMPSAYGAPVVTVPQSTYGGSTPIDAAHGGCAAGGDCGQTYQVYGGLEYVLWWLRATNLPPLVGAIPAPLANTMGDLPTGAIDPILGGQSTATGAHSGVRLTLGYWLDPNQRIGVEASGFDLERGSNGTFFSGSGNAAIGPLFLGAEDGKQTIIGALVPGQRTGFVDAGLNDHLWGAEANVRFKTVTVFSDANNVLVGARTLQFDNGLAVATSSTSMDPEHFAFTSFDSFGTHNQFYGAQVGMSSDFRWGSWFLNATEKLALGDVHEAVNIQGNSQQFIAGQLVATNSGGILAQPTNIGHYSRDRFAALPEITLNFGYQFDEHFRVYFGYDFFYLSNVVRPGDQIDAVDSRQIPFLANFDPTVKATRPALSFNETGLWVQGMNFGVEVRY
jgi:hypothetical protein